MAPLDDAHQAIEGSGGVRVTRPGGSC